MNSDFRKEFYNKYNSTFKVDISDFDSKSVNKMWRNFDYKYLPLISHVPNDSPILELGSGRGFMLEYLRNNGFRNLKGIDISKEQVEISLEKGFDVEVADATHFLNNCKKKYQVIIALDFIEHFYKEELITLFVSIFNCLQDNGILILHTPNGQSIISPNIIYGDLTHLTVFSPNSAQQILKLVGFKDIRFYESKPVPKNINGIIRLILWKCIKLHYNLIRLVESGATEKILSQNFIIAATK